MSEKKINLDDFISSYGVGGDINTIKTIMREFGKELLELAAENIEVDKFYYRLDENKQSILDTIKQVE